MRAPRFAGLHWPPSSYPSCLRPRFAKRTDTEERIAELQKQVDELQNARPPADGNTEPDEEPVETPVPKGRRGAASAPKGRPGPQAPSYDDLKSQNNSLKAQKSQLKKDRETEKLLRETADAHLTTVKEENRPRGARSRQTVRVLMSVAQLQNDAVTQAQMLLDPPAKQLTCLHDKPIHLHDNTQSLQVVATKGTHRPHHVRAGRDGGVRWRSQEAGA